MTRLGFDSCAQFRFWVRRWKECPTVGLVCLLFVHNAALNVFRPAGTAIASAKK